jgi:phosphoesterase RecJ-like protein
MDFLKEEGLHVLNIDHHHDNTHFGTVNLVEPEASCTAEIVYALAGELGAEITPPIAHALYVALVTDTGRFMYENTTPEAHSMAADLIRAGVEPHHVYRRLYEDLPYSRLKLLQKALASLEQHDDGALTIAHLTRGDFGEAGALETDSEGIVDHLRAVEGTAVAVLVRELLGDGREGMRKVSLRATDSRVDVSRIARAMNGGGHPQAAGFSTSLPYTELIDSLREQVGRQLRA